MLIHFKAKLTEVGNWKIIRLPNNASSNLPSRGMVMVEGTINGFRFQRELEPDGVGSHFLRLDKKMVQMARTKPGKEVKLVIETSKEWPEPEVPADLKKALDGSPEANNIWKDITPMARWDWIRWIRSTKNPETRKHRIEVTFSKFKAGKRRPCCFNRTACTFPELSKNGVLALP